MLADSTFVTAFGQFATEWKNLGTDPWKIQEYFHHYLQHQGKLQMMANFLHPLSAY